MPLNVPDEAAFEKLDAAGRQQWFSENVRTGLLGIEKGDLRPSHHVGAELADGFDKLYRLAQSGFGSRAPRDTDWTSHFGRLSTEAQLKIFRGWQTHVKATKLGGPKADQAADPEFVSPGEIHITLPDGSQRIERWVDGDPDYEPSSKPPSEPWSMPKFGLTLPVRIGMGGIGLLMLGGVYLTLTGDGDTEAELGPSANEQAEEVDGADSSSPANDGGEDAEADPDSSSSDSAQTAAPVEPLDECAAVHEQQLVLDLSSPDVQPALPIEFALGAGDFRSPALNWTTVPDETTEIVVRVKLVSAENAAAYIEDPFLWWGGASVGPSGPIGQERWLVAGIDPATTGLAQSSQSDQTLPDGAEEQPNGGLIATFDQEPGSHMYRGPGLPGDHVLFTVFALCGTDGLSENISEDFAMLRRLSIATGWFISEYTN